MGFDVSIDISIFTVFIQGLLSFFSPCVFPLIPIYMGYLAGGLNIKEKLDKSQFKIFLNTFGFVIGISCAFFLLGLGFTAFGQILSDYSRVISIIGGLIIIFFGLYSLGVFGFSKTLSKELRIKWKMDKLKLNPLTALVFGFTFSFAWTPCVGPTLTSVLLMTSSAASMSKGLVLIGVYTLGFVIPILILGCFTGAVLNSFKKHKGIVKYTIKIGGLLMLIMGVLMVTGLTDNMSKYLSSSTVNTEIVDTEQSENVVEEEPEEEPVVEEVGNAPNFALIDQNGVEHKLSDYKGKTIFLNFWATWCGPCQSELGDIQAIYEEYGYNKEDVIILGMANPSTQTKQNQDVSTIEVGQFINQMGLTYPTLMDLTGEVFAVYGVRSFPTTFMIDKNGDVFGYITGALPKEAMYSIIEQTIEGNGQK